MIGDGMKKVPRDEGEKGSGARTSRVLSCSDEVFLAQCVNESYFWR